MPPPKRGFHKAMTLRKAKKIARSLGLTLREACSGDYRVNFRDGNETRACYTGNPSRRLRGRSAPLSRCDECDSGLTCPKSEEEPVSEGQSTRLTQGRQQRFAAFPNRVATLPSKRRLSRLGATNGWGLWLNSRYLPVQPLSPRCSQALPALPSHRSPRQSGCISSRHSR